MFKIFNSSIPRKLDINHIPITILFKCSAACSKNQSLTTSTSEFRIHSYVLLTIVNKDIIHNHDKQQNQLMHYVLIF